MLEQIEKTIYKVAIYIRLSKEDVDRGYDESESIKNQRTLLTEYVQKLGWKYQLIDTYIDQGFTGTNFNRPAFQRMIKDINLGKVNMVVTKDLSRLGRDYIETGEYIEKWFPENNVRYVSVTDGIDTYIDSTNNDITPFKAIMNDYYAKDISQSQVKGFFENHLTSFVLLIIGFTFMLDFPILLMVSSKTMKQRRQKEQFGIKDDVVSE